MSSQTGYYKVEIVNPSINYPVEIIYTDPSGQQRTINISYGSSTQGYIFVSEENPTIQVIVQKFVGNQKTGDNVVCYNIAPPNKPPAYACYENIPCYNFTVTGSGTITLDLNQINQCAGHTQENGYYLPNQEMPTIAPPTGNPEYISDQLGWMYPVQIDGVTVYSAWNKVYIPDLNEQDNQQLLIDICGNNPNVYIYTNPNGAYRWYCGDILKQIQASMNNQQNQIPNRWSPDLVNECKSQGMNGSVTVDGITIPCNLILTPQCFQPATVCINGGAGQVSIYEMFENPSGYCNQVEATSIMAYGTPTSDCFIVPKPVDVGASESTDIYFNVKPKAGKVLTNIPRLALGSAWNYQVDLNSLGQDNTSEFPSDLVSECQKNPNGTVTNNGTTIPCQVVLAQTNNSSELYGRTGNCFKLMPVCFNQPGKYTVKYIWTQPVCGVNPGETIAQGSLTEPGCVQIPVVNDGLNDPGVVVYFKANNGKEYTQYLSSYFMTVTIGESSSSSSNGSNSNTSTSTTGTSSNSNTTTPTTQSSQNTNKIPYTVGHYLSLEGHYLAGASESQQTTSGAQSSSTTGTQTPTSTPYTVDHYLSKIAQIEGSSSNTSTSVTQSSQNTNKTNNTTGTKSSSTTGTQTSAKQEQSQTQTKEPHTQIENPVNTRLIYEPPRPPARLESPQPLNKEESSHIQTKESHTTITNPVNTRLLNQTPGFRPELQHPLNKEENNQNKKPETNVQHNESHNPTVNPVITRLVYEPPHLTTKPEPSHQLNREENVRHEPHTPTANPVNIRLQTEPIHPVRPQPPHPIEQVHSKVSTSEHNIPKHPIEHVIKHETHSKRNVKKEERKKKHEKRNEEEEEEIKRHLELHY